MNTTLNLSGPHCLSSKEFYQKDNQGLTPFLRACLEGNVEDVQTLLQQDEHFLYELDQHNRSALHLAVLSENSSLVKQLIERDPDSLAYTDSDGNTPLHLAARERSTLYAFVHLKNAMENRGLSLNESNLAKQTPLHEAVEGQNEQAVRLLLKAGVDPLTSNGQELTPYHSAATLSNVRILNELLNANPEGVHARSLYGLTPLHFAAAKGNNRAVVILLNNGAEVNALSQTLGRNPKAQRSKVQLTPMDEAVIRGYMKTAACLKRFGGDLAVNRHLPPNS